MRRMTTSQRVPRRALLRRVGPWVVLGAMLTGCASPAAQTALGSIQGHCADGTADQTAACRTLALVLGDAPTVTAADPTIASIATSMSGGVDASPGRGSRDKQLRTSAKHSARRSTGGSTRQATEPGARKRSQPARRRTTRLPRVRMPAINSAYFGGGVTVARFRVSGDTRGQILRSIRSKGPHGGAQGVTQPYMRYRFTFRDDRRGRCRIVRTGASAVTMSFRITLPTWAATTGTDHDTASWWAAELRETAAHERKHVRMWRNAVRQANRVVATSSCGTVGRRLDAVWRKAILANCRYDAASYGVSMRACLRR